MLLPVCFFKLGGNGYAMASAGINCFSTVSQHKCKLRFQMFQRTRKPAFAKAFVLVCYLLSYSYLHESKVRIEIKQDPFLNVVQRNLN